MAGIDMLVPTSSRCLLASAVVRRGIRLWFSTAAALIMYYFVFSRNLGSQYLTDLAGIVGSESLTDELYLMPNPLTNFDSIFNTFWVSHFFSYQAGNSAFPAQTLWIFMAVFQQSYTVHTTMVVIPFTPAQMADGRRGSLRLERMTGDFFTESTSNDSSAPQVRADNYLVIVGLCILSESVDFLQRVFKNPVFLYLGKQSCSYFLLQSVIIYTLGVHAAKPMMSNGGNKDAYSRATGVAFIICLPVTAAGGKVFYWLLDRPSHAFGRLIWAWLKE